MSLPEAFKIQLAAGLAQTMTIEEIDILGRHVDPKFKAHLLSGEPFGLTLRPDQAARTLVRHFDGRNELPRILGLLVHIHSHQDSTLVGRAFAIPNFDAMLQTLGSVGLRFDPVSGTLQEAREDDVNWGILKEGEVYHFCHLSVDIAGNSLLQIKYPRAEIEIVYHNFYSMLKKIVKRYNGQIWNWAGDGGIITFYTGDKVQDAVFCALQLQLQLVVFNLSRSSNRFEEPLRVRIAAHDGLTVYKENKGTVLSEAINFAAHLEKSGTPVNAISISRSVYGHLSPRLQKIFEPRGVFEDIPIFTSMLELDWMKEKERPSSGGEQEPA